MYVDSSSRKRGDLARLLSPQMPKTRSSCLEFWYHMYGSTVGTLTLYKKTGSSIGTRIWSRSGNRGDEWLVAQVNVWSPVRSFKISFQGTVGGNTGDIAIDDVKMFSSRCAAPGKYVCIARSNQKSVVGNICFLFCRFLYF